MHNENVWVACLADMRSADWGAAREKLEILRQNLPVDADYKSMALAAHELGMWEFAVYFAKQGVREKCNRWYSFETELSCNFIAGHSYDQMGDLVTALRYYKRARALQPESECYDVICKGTEIRLRHKRYATYDANWNYVKKAILRLIARS